MIKYKYYLLLVVSLVITNNSQAKDSIDASISEKPKTEFLRIKKNQYGVEESLQLANARYVPISGIPNGMYVDLISAVHIADKSYYDNLNELFKTYDVVLYELVAPEGTRVGEPQASEGKNLLSMLQQGMKNALGLTFQLEEVDYSPQNFVHADISPEDFKNSMDEKGESFFSMFLRMWLVGMQQQATNQNAMGDMDILMALFAPDSQKQLKIIAAKQFMQMDPIMNAIEGDQGSTIVTARNLKALKVLRQEIEKGNKTFAIFYGAAHMPEMAKVMMKKFKLKPAQVNWVDAWDLKASSNK